MNGFKVNVPTCLARREGAPECDVKDCHAVGTVRIWGNHHGVQVKNLLLCDDHKDES